MTKDNGVENSWADQWDASNSSPRPVASDRKARYSKKFGESFNKTKAAASTGMKKVKDGANVGINWVKLKVKYNKSNQGQQQQHGPN